MKTILLIDDDHDLSGLIKSVLEYADYRVLLSHEAQKGIETAKEEKPDLILLDIIMPGMDGAQAITILKSESSTKNIPVIFLTGLVSDEDINIGSEGINIGGVYHKSIAKPFENEKLLKVVKDALD